ncbi:MAG: LPS export ABC transporter periplasmic protein LptC [Selenomonadaceae bacterium]|nr:LPS export ABC transporter periplasmic protein LptC [Selenomonadaceae bacterium]
MSTREKIFAAIVTVFFVCLVVWAVRTAPPTPPTIDKEKIDPPTVLEYEGNTIVEEVDGVVIWELTCSKMRIDSVTQLAELDDVIAKFYQHEKDKVWQLTAKKGLYDQNSKLIHVEGEVVVQEIADEDKKSWQLTADKGAYDQTNKLIHAEGNVVVINNEGAKLTSNVLDWFGEQEMLVATGEVKISKDDVRAFGDMAYSNNGFKHFGLMGNAKLLKGVKDDSQ